MLSTVLGIASLNYDPLMRLTQVSAGANTTRFAYDGLDLIAEYDGSNNLLRRHVFGPGTDDPIVWYEGSGTTDRRFLGSDERGSIVSVSDSSGNMLGLNKYDEYGIPQSTNIGRFQYTGQAWLPELGMQYSKARIYSPTLGRFLQTDPAGGSNLYAYVGNDPIGATDPSGMIPRMPQSGDDMSRFVDTTPQGVGFGQHSYDWAGQYGTPVSGRIEEIGIARDIREYNLMMRQLGLSGSSSEEYLACVKYCNATKSVGSDDEIVVQAGPQYRWIKIGDTRFDPTQFDRIQLAQNTPSGGDMCGSEGSGWVPDVIWGSACGKHDSCYASAGNAKEGCDVGLIFNITKDCAKAGISCVGIGLIYGVGLIITGYPGGPSRKAYNRAQRR